MDAYECLFGEKPMGYSSPLEKGDHPELIMSPKLNEDGCALYMSLVGQRQWLISLGCFDIACAIMTMSHFRAALRKGLMKRMKLIYGYVKQYPKGAIHVRLVLPNYSDLPLEKFELTSIHRNIVEELPSDMPMPQGKLVLTTMYEEANLYHDYLTGRLVTGVLHLVNQTPINWYCKQQATVEMATYGSEFNAVRTAMEQIIDMQYTLCMLGVWILDSYMFSDNQGVHMNSTVLHLQLNKCHNALAYHRVHKAIMVKIMKFYKIDGKKNPSDIVSKQCSYTDVWLHVKPLLFWHGDTSEIPDKGE